MASTSQTSFLVVDGNTYLVDQRSIAAVTETVTVTGKGSEHGTRDYIPVSVLLPETPLPASWEDVNVVVKDLQARDDVWSPGFISGIFGQAASADAWVDQSPDVNGSIFFFQVTAPDRPPPGPYVIDRWTSTLHPVSRLFEDTQRAFIYGVTPHENGKSFEQIISGYRFGVKDLIDVAGCTTGMGNRAWADIHEPASTTAPVVQQLLDAGAILVGKTKTTQFAEGSEPYEWIDHFCPFTPRGDGFQKPSSSSTGSAAAIAAYPWLDFTIGTDTGGSIRHPAGVNGIYGIRPSLGFTSSDGVLCTTSIMDTVGLFARNATILREAGLAIASPGWAPEPIPAKPKYRLLYPVRAPKSEEPNQFRWFPREGEPGEAAAAEQMMEDTMQKIESHLECVREPFELEKLWRETRPEGQPETLDEAIGILYSIITNYTSVRNVIDPFIAKYREQRHGRTPFIDPIVRARHAFGREQTQDTYDAAVETGKIFSKWTSDLLMKRNSAEEIPILIFPQSFGQPNYRDTWAPSVVFWDKFAIYSFGYLCGFPDHVIPIGEVPYTSSITETEEFLPVALSVVAQKNEDEVLFNLLRDLERKGITREVKTGSRAY